jgi:hypothetical protein
MLFGTNCARKKMARTVEKKTLFPRRTVTPGPGQGSTADEGGIAHSLEGQWRQGMNPDADHQFCVPSALEDEMVRS